MLLVCLGSTPPSSALPSRERASTTEVRATPGAPFVVQGGEFFRASLVWETGESRYLPFKILWRAAFSGDGSMLAVADPFCCRDATDIVVHGADGSQRTLARVPGLVQSLSWSPDGTQIAVSSAHDGSLLGEIWAVPLGGGPPALLFDGRDPDDGGAFAPSILIDAQAGLSWSPDGSEVAFIGSVILDAHDGSVAIEDAQQLWVVSSTDPRDYRLYAAVQASCQWVCRTYRDPDWSPDGSSITAYVVEDTYGDGPSADPTLTQTHLVSVTRGAGSPTTLTTGAGSGSPPRFSADGTEISYALRTSRDVEAAGILDLRTGATRTAPVAGYSDWQPCPAGACVEWVEPPPPPIEVRLRLHHRPGRVVAVGKGAPARTGKVAAVLERYDRRWKRVEYKRVPLDRRSRYRAVLRSVPPRGRCRVVARYGAVHLDAYAIRRFRCGRTPD